MTTAELLAKAMHDPAINEDLATYAAAFIDGTGNRLDPLVTQHGHNSMSRRLRHYDEAHLTIEFNTTKVTYVDTQGNELLDSPIGPLRGTRYEL